MGRPRGSKNKNQKNPYESIKSFCEDVDVLGNDEAALRDRIAKVSLDNAALREAEKADEDLAKMREQVKVAFEPYKDAYKAQGLMLSYLRSRLGEIGKPNGESGLKESEVEVARAEVAEVQTGGLKSFLTVGELQIDLEEAIAAKK